MKLEEYRFSSREIEFIKRYRDNQSDPRLKGRFLGILMVAERANLDFVCTVLGVSGATLQRWFRCYTLYGIDALNSFQYKSKTSYITESEQADLVVWIKKKTPGNREIIQKYILDTWKINYSLSAISKLLNRNGIKRLRPKLTPGKSATLEAQIQFILRYHQVKEFIENDPGIVQMFIDGMHLVHQVVPSLCWGSPKDRPVLSTNTSRNRLNILGAYCLQSNDLIHLTSEENCNSKQVIKFLEKMNEIHCDKHSVVLYVDNAPYFHAKEVQEWIGRNSRIILNHLPTYSPNLNLIERLWRFVKGKLVNNRYYKHYKTFRASTFRLLNHIYEHHDQLNRLMNENFELIRQH